MVVTVKILGPVVKVIAASNEPDAFEYVWLLITLPLLRITTFCFESILLTLPFNTNAGAVTVKPELDGLSIVIKGALHVW